LADQEQELRSVQVDATVEVRDLALREVDLRIMPWGKQIETSLGPEEFARGAFSKVRAEDVLLMGLEHEAHVGMGQDGQPVLTRRPIGKAIALEDREDGQIATFKVAGTQAGDEYLALAVDRVVRGASVEFRTVTGGTRTVTRNGRRVRVHESVDLTAVSPTYRPAYADAQVLAVRSEDKDLAEQTKREDPAPPEPDEPEKAPEIRSEAALAKIDEGFARIADSFTTRLESLEERARSSFAVPAAGEVEKPKPNIGKWVEYAVRMLTGERITESEFRTVADMITSENIGVVPPAYLSELIGVIDNSRPFLSSTRRLNTPAAGMSMVVPKITERPSTGVQSTEKSELSSNDTTITTETFNAVTIGGVGDISLQLLKRSDPSFLELYLQLLAEAYAIDCEDQALRALFNEIGGGVGGASSLDPDNLTLGAAYQTSFDAIRRPPDTIWLSTEAVGGFIDAKATTTNAPLYSNITANATVGGGISGTIQGLRAVHTPALDAHGSFAVVGPSSGFAWAEDGTYTLQVDVPSKAGRDVALVGMLWFAPWYPDAFTAYNVAS
jgi:HK97 family phage major capsid protein